ncbi:preprotein translocase subunit YajC [Myxococcota bacterium]|nr:preprotein translocase subunit YajC [Myxococcota bacterium]MBU1380061.1 preprotein translocase subunit YajC [Myxococcota bacterium]MBU1495519.1 preprotein translocase subunit YajC [Myxococcota bacterium]
MSVPPKDKQQNQQPGCGGGGSGALMQFGIIAVLVVFMYLFLIRPQQKRQKEHQSLLNALMKGDKVITTGGMLGTIVAINDRIVTLEIADKTRVKILRSYIQGKQFGNIETEGTPAEGDAKKD